MAEVEERQKNGVFAFWVSEESRSSLSRGSAEYSKQTATGPRSPLRYSGQLSADQFSNGTNIIDSGITYRQTTCVESHIVQYGLPAKLSMRDADPDAERGKDGMMQGPSTVGGSQSWQSGHPGFATVHVTWRGSLTPSRRRVWTWKEELRTQIQHEEGVRREQQPHKN
jgi:hypothetical protein